MTLLFDFKFSCEQIYHKCPDNMLPFSFSWLVSLRHASFGSTCSSLRVRLNVSGVCKSGTTTLFSAFAGPHPQLLFKRKEMHWWDTATFDPTKTMRRLTSDYASASKKIVQSVRTNKRIQDQPIIVEGTPRTLWDGDSWSLDPLNAGLQLPAVLTPHKLRHVTPDVKFIVILRDPVRRLLSDYKFFYRTGKKSSEDFHNKVVRAIAWWHSCVASYPEKRCVYGIAPPGLPALDTDECFKKYRNNTDKCRMLNEWRNNAATRLRIGLYDLFLQDWFSVFPRSQFLFLKHKELFENGTHLIQSHIYPFLGIPKLNEDRVERMKYILSRKKATGKGNTRIMPKTSKILQEFHAPFNARLAKTLGDEKWLFKAAASVYH